MEIAKLWTRSFDITFLAAWSVGRAGGVPDSEQQLRGHAVRSIAESGGLVLSKKARPSRALFENMNDGHGQNRFTALVHYTVRSEEHTSELQSQSNLVCRLLLE